MKQLKSFFRKKLCAVALAGILATPLSVHATLPGDLDANGGVSIAEVQKVVNSFLGLVPDITPVKVLYGATSSFKISGNNLGDGILVTSTGACTTLTEQSGGTTSLRTYSCVPDVVGPWDITVKSAANGAVLAQAKFTVPTPQVTMETTAGTVVIELNPAKAPKTVNNFLRYVHEGFYSNTIFHRVIKGFVVQGGGYVGGYSTDLTQKGTHPAIELEAPLVTGLTNVIGTIAMARSQALNSATSQFFISTANNTFLDASSGGYAVFGNIVQGLDIVLDLSAVPVTTKVFGTVTFENFPESPIGIISATQTR